MTIPRVRRGGVWVARGYDDVFPASENSRDGLVRGTYVPDAATTGVLPGVPRTDFNSRSTTGTVELTTDNQTYENLDFWGDIRLVGASNNVFKNCFFHGGIGHPPSNRGCVYMFNSDDHSGAEFWDCTFSAQSPSYYRDGIVGNKYEAHRCHSYNVNDGFGAYAAQGGDGVCGVGIFDSYVHDLVFWSQDPAHTDGTHNDCIQYQGGSGLQILGNNLVGSQRDATDSVSPSPAGKYAGQCIVLNMVTAPSSDILVDWNRFSLGSCHIGMGKTATYPVLNVTLGTNNRFSREIRDQYPPNPDYHYIRIQSSGMNITGLYEQHFIDGALLTVGRTTGIKII